jgi:hypothetical protein
MSSLICEFNKYLEVFHINKENFNNFVRCYNDILSIKPNTKKYFSMNLLFDISDETLELLKNPKLRNLIIRNNETKFYNVLNKSNIPIIFPPYNIHASAGLLNYEIFINGCDFNTEQFNSDYVWNYLKNKIYEMYKKYYNINKINTIFVNNVIMAYVCSYNKKYIKWTIQNNKILNKEVFDEYLFIELFRYSIFYKNTKTNYNYLVKNLSLYQQLYILSKTIKHTYDRKNYIIEERIDEKKINLLKYVIKKLADKINSIKDTLSPQDIELIKKEIFYYYSIDYNSIHKKLIVENLITVINIREISIECSLI